MESIQHLRSESDAQREQLSSLSQHIINYESANSAKDEEMATLQLQHQKELEDVRNELIGKCRDLEKYQQDLTDEIIDLNNQLEYCSNEREDIIAQIFNILNDNQNLQNQSQSDQSRINDLQTENLV